MNLKIGTPLERIPVIYIVTVFREELKRFEHGLVLGETKLLCSWYSQNEKPSEEEILEALRD